MRSEFPRIDDYGLFINHTLFNRDDDRLTDSSLGSRVRNLAFQRKRKRIDGHAFDGERHASFIVQNCERCALLDLFGEIRRPSNISSVAYSSNC